MTASEIKKLKYPWLAKAPVDRRTVLVGIGKINPEKKNTANNAQYLYRRRDESRNASMVLID
jgi:hypothetical protein